MSTNPHKPGTSTREQLLLNSAFFALFPGFFFYHTLLGTGTTGAFLGGYFSPVSLVFVIPLIAIAFQRCRQIPRFISNIAIHYAVFLGYFLIIIVCNSIAGASRAIVINQLLCI